MIYLILGMHKSGTTLVAEILHESGINMVDDMQSNLSYEKGDKFERKTTNEINKALLDSHHSLEKAPTDISLTEKQEQNIKQVIFSYEQRNEDWGFKDPRTCLTYEVWKRFLPDHKILIVYRNPYQVVSHYFNSTRRPDKRIIRSYKALKNWKKYNELLIKIIERNAVPIFVINYQDLMSREEILQEISEFAGKPLYDARDAKRYKRQKENGWLFELFELFSKQSAASIFSRLERQKIYIV